MASKEQIFKIVQLRGLGFSLEEIAKLIGLSKSTIAYQLKQLKEKSTNSNLNDVFIGAMLGGAIGAAGGLALAVLLDELNK